MELSSAVAALGALAQEARLEVFRFLVRAGPAGAPAGEIARALGQPPSTMSFHLRQLALAGLIAGTREGRSLRYALRSERLRELLWFLGEECCQGRPRLCAAPLERVGWRLDEARRAGEVPTVLFVCSRNSARSQMAEALLRREARGRVHAQSAGIRPESVDLLALRALRERGIATEGLVAKDLGDLLGKVTVHYAIVVCEAASAHCPEMVPFAPTVLHWPLPDPAGGRIGAFRRTRDDLARRIRRWLREELPALERARARKGA